MQGYTFFLIFDQKRRFWILVRTRGGSNVYPQSMFLAKIRKIKNKQNYHENFQFLLVKKSLYIAWACFRNVEKKQGPAHSVTKK